MWYRCGVYQSCHLFQGPVKVTVIVRGMPQPTWPKNEEKSCPRVQYLLGTELDQICLFSLAVHIKVFSASCHSRVTMSQYSDFTTTLHVPGGFWLQKEKQKRDTFDFFHLFPGLGLTEHWSWQKPWRASTPVTPKCLLTFMYYFDIVWDACKKYRSLIRVTKTLIQ